jgi:hypothetical protein
LSKRRQKVAVARVLGIDVPPGLLAITDEVID